MRRGGRPRTGSCICVALYSCFVNLVAGADYGVPVEIKLWDTGRTPIAHMVDVTNGFGLKVLAEHNFLNDNNIAFSPYGLMGIMVALFEGVDGESSYQIQRGMQLPWNRNVMRIGFRDIHRTLKTYFVPEEGFLAGLALNNENVTFNDSYKKILRFYGFDLENDQLPTIPPKNTSSTNETSAAPSTTAPSSETTTVSVLTPTMSTESKLEETTTAMVGEETTLNPNAETIDVDIRAPTETTTVLSSLAPDTESSSITTVNVDPTTTVVSETITQTSVAETTTVSPSPTTTVLAPLNTQAASDTVSTTETSMSMETDAETIAQQTSQASSALIDPTTANDVATTVDMGASTTDSTSVATTITTTLNDITETTRTMDETTSMPNTSTDGSTTSSDRTTADLSTTTDSPLETLQRRKKSIVDFIFTNPPYVDDYFFYKSYHVGPELPDTGFDDKIFLANGLKSVQVTYMHYDTVLEHAYLPHLGASALRLPLDSDRYYLLVVLPTRGGSAELGRLLARMARESDLADVYAALRPRRVRAVVPSFIVKGHITLTTDLQKLGISNVFEPRQRDFSPMTRQRGVFVRSIEQAVSVAIRNYRPDTHSTNRYVINRDPVTFSATYPFLYFVMDATIHVALMAGKMVDPLNSRIL